MTFTDALKQFIEKALFSQNITSAGGDSPKVNVVRDVDINPADFEEIIRAEVERIIDERVTVKEETIEESAGSAGLSESNVASLVRTGVATAKNPLAPIDFFMARLPHTVLIALAIALAPLIVNELKKPGSMLDVRFKRLMRDEFNAFLDRQEQRDTLLGLRQIIVQSEAGFLVKSGMAMSENNLRQVREGGVDGNRLALIDMTDHSKELFGPLG